MTNVRYDNMDVRRATKALQQARAMRMQFCRQHLNAWVPASKQGCLASGGGTTIEDRFIEGGTIKAGFATTGQQCDQLRSFILNRDAAFPVGIRPGYIARKNTTRRR